MAIAAPIYRDSFAEQLANPIGLHAITGTVITASFVWLIVDRWRHPVRNAA